MFSKPEAAGISDTYTAVRLVGGNDLDDEGKAFMKRYGVGGYPTLLAMTADGAVVGRSFERTVEGILATMAKAVTDNAAFLTKEADLAKKTDDASVRELAGLYKSRSQLTEARARYEKLTASKPALEDQENLLEVLSGVGDGAARKALLKTLVDTRKDNPKNIRWRTDLATADLPTRVSSREEWIDVMGKRKAIFTTLLTEVTKPEDQAHVRGLLAGILANTGDQEGAEAHWDWILENAPKSEAAAGALWMKGNGLIRQGQFEGDPAKVREAKALWVRLAAEHPDTQVGKRASSVMPQLDGLISMLEKKKADAEAAKKKAEDAKKKGEAPKDADEKGEKKDTIPATPIR